jgi:hypothetical protein
MYNLIREEFIYEKYLIGGKKNDCKDGRGF